MNSPIEHRDISDPGDEVLRKYRYQHAYGVILSIGMVTGRLPYKAIWCEQQEDFLAERADGLFEAYQVKTRNSELGAWKLSDEALWKSIARFIKLEKRYPGKVQAFKFVSNTRVSDSSAKDREYLSPVKLLTGIKAASSCGELSGAVKRGFEFLHGKLVDLTHQELFSVLRRLDVVPGPTERAYEDELCQRHIAALRECNQMSASALRAVCEALITRVSQAASLVCDAPSRDWTGIIHEAEKDPYLLAKRITADDIILTVRDTRSPGFTFLPEFASLTLGGADSRLDALHQKMIRGGLAAHYETMRRRALSAEQGLLDLATRPDDGKAIFAQIESVVLAECDDAYLRARQKGGTFGSAMLVDVQDRLKRISETEPGRVHQQAYDCLVGVAGLLSSECKVWWSEPFNVEDKS